jgi:hypothetical protein
MRSLSCCSGAIVGARHGNAEIAQEQRGRAPPSVSSLRRMGAANWPGQLVARGPRQSVRAGPASSRATARTQPLPRAPAPTPARGPLHRAAAPPLTAPVGLPGDAPRRRGRRGGAVPGGQAGLRHTVPGEPPGRARPLAWWVAAGSWPLAAARSPALARPPAARGPRVAGRARRLRRSGARCTAARPLFAFAPPPLRDARHQLRAQRRPALRAIQPLAVG